jgi:hypothetical protein
MSANFSWIVWDFLQISESAAMEFLIDGLLDFFEFSANSKSCGSFSGTISRWFLFLGYWRFFYCFSSCSSSIRFLTTLIIRRRTMSSMRSNYSNTSVMADKVIESLFLSY